MATGQGYVVRLKTTFLAQNNLNVFHYTQTIGIGGAAQLAFQFAAGIVVPVRALASASCQFLALDVENLDDPSDFAYYPLSGVGSVSGENMPTVNALSFTYQRGRLDTKSGGKRFGAMVEGQQNAGLPTAATFILIAQLEAALEGPLASGSDTWRPRVLGKRTGQLGTFLNPISAVNFLGITTQNTRKFYTSPGF